MAQITCKYKQDSQTITLHTPTDNIYEIQASEIDQGVTGNKGSIKYWVDTIGTSKSATLHLKHTGSGNTTTYTVSTSETIPSNIKVVIEKGAILSDGGGSADLTINGSFPKPPEKCFDWTGSGTVSFGSGAVKEVIVTWFGENTTPGITDMTSIIQAAADSLDSCGGMITFPKNTYKISSSIGIADDATSYNHVYYLNGNGSVLSCGATVVSGVFAIGYTAARSTSFTIDHFMIGTDQTRPTDGSIGIKVYRAQRGAIQRCKIYGFDKGIYGESWGLPDGGVKENTIYKNNIGYHSVWGAIAGSDAVCVRNNTIASNNIGVQIDGGYAANITNNQINDNRDIGVWVGGSATIPINMPTVTTNVFENNVNIDVKLGGTQPIYGGMVKGNSHLVPTNGTAYYLQHIGFAVEIYPAQIFGSAGATVYKTYDGPDALGWASGINSSEHNYVKNGAFGLFANNTTEPPDDWTEVNANGTLDNTFTTHAAFSALVTSNGTWCYLQQALPSHVVQFLKGTYVTMFAWCRAASTNDQDSRIGFVDDTGSHISQIIPKDNAFHPIVVQAKIHSGTANIYIRLWSNYSGNNDVGDILNVCNVSLRSGYKIYPYTPHPFETFRKIETSATWNPGSIANGAEEAKQVLVKGALLGDFAMASFSLDVQDLTLDAQVTAGDFVTCVLANNTGGAIDLGAGTLYVRVFER